MKNQVLLTLTLFGLCLCLGWMVQPSNGQAIDRSGIVRQSEKHNASPPKQRRLPFEAKVEPALLKKLLESTSQEQHQVIVELAHQTNLTSLAKGLTPVDRRRHVVDALQSTAQQSQVDLLAFLQERQANGHVDQFRSFWIFNGLSVTADADTVLSLTARPEVRMLRLDRWRRWLDPASPIENSIRVGNDAVEWNIGQIRADLAWSALGQDGEGVTVAILDTGVDWQHPALQTRYRGYKPGGLTVHLGNWFCTTDEGYLYPVDGHGHGTHVAGIAVGGRDVTGTAIGVAPGARWIAVKTLNDAGYGYDSWIHAAFEWIMAPAGDPALAPDVVNGSWGAPDGADETLRPDIQALRAAGIVPVFAAGNNGPHPSSIQNPASYPESIAVGATDELDLVTTFSGRGPSVWGEVKPEVVAPGAQIRSSLPGGTYGTYNGTSMAAPHVTGMVALLLQADPTLSVGEIEEITSATALPLGDEIPGNDAGWGRIDAYRATAVAFEAGFVTGQVTRLPDQQPLPTARVRASEDTGEPLAMVQADGKGHYRLALPPGQYTLHVEAFGYVSKTVDAVPVQPALTTTVDAILSPLPTGVLWGHVTNAETEGPVGTDILAVDTPVATTSDPQTGQYSLALPSGTYRVEIRKNGYRRHVASDVEIVADQDTRMDVALAPAPTLLLVDSGQWYYGSQVGYFEQALDGGDYVYETWQIRDLATDVPEVGDLRPYDIVLWTAPLDAPGLIGAGDAISTYLSIGGNLFLSGQDVGFWDSGLSAVGYSKYFREMLKAEAVADDASRDNVEGLPDDILSGLSLPMNGPDSARNQYSPDAIAVLDPMNAVIVGRYADDGDAALRVSGCQSYRGLYLASGLEGLGEQASRTKVMDRAVTWLDTPYPSVAAGLYPPHQEEVWLKDSFVTYTVELQNLGKAADQFTFEFSQSDWPATVLDSTFSRTLTQSVVLAPCQTQMLGVKVTVPQEVSWNLSDTVTLTVRSRSDPMQTSQVTFVSKAPAPVLLVDDHRWRDVSHRYLEALDTNRLPYDVWRLDPNPLPDIHSPSLARLRRYPLVVWFTAADWFATLTPKDEARLAAYLDGGGRLLLTSQDYLYTSGFTDFSGQYLGVAGYTESLTATQAVGAVGSAVGEGFDRVDLTYPFPNWSDALRPTPEAQIAFWGQHGQPIALTRADRAWKTAFFAFPLEALSDPAMAAVAGRTLDWLSPLGDSSLSVDRPVAAEGAQLAFTLAIRNTGPAPLNSVTLSNTVPPSATYVAGSLTGPAEYDAGANRFTWHGALDPGQAVTVTYRLQADASLPAGATVRNVAHLEDESGLNLDRVAISRIDTPDLSTSTKVAGEETTYAGRWLTYTLTLHNGGPRTASAQLTDLIPPFTRYRPGSAWASSGSLTETDEALQWTGSLLPEHTATLVVPVWISPTATSLYALNQATLDDGWGRTYPLEAFAWVKPRAFLPLVLR